jgi:hypothetical protein
MSGRSYARIVWSNNRLSVHLVNPDGEQFTMFVESFFKLLEEPDKPSLVKKMDKHPRRTRGYHGGEILARICESGSDWLLTLYFGSLTQRINKGDKGSPVNVLASQEFILPKNEMESFKTSIEIMMDQTRKFDRLKMQADASPDWTFFNKNPGDAKE